ncbi:MAG: hypothetical protein COX62_09075 [Deltaproteobacteria bacterium CG_4_10_14_0_2_um_filter_43_8]|nr:MAG: hypothetical protein COV43_03435 [Deltaproteobacteria bacterium CG11_big_fil_rev_8_21_14_0_20_42_23]PJA18204.1 MAG: hypothetical protein COX62_09075 [Deltaproteobacteria bacterium CG_4_10_14_0_2_um_filter_43_8]PJC63484.1 MAG: hypothetical protein CO021_09100 [Deltaproteobacteria bacterium CG_4_9_14_0_2_um_filter_42_21]
MSKNRFQLLFFFKLRFASFHEQRLFSFFLLPFLLLSLFLLYTPQLSFQAKASIAPENSPEKNILIQNAEHGLAPTKKPYREIIVNTAATKLTLYEDGLPVKTFPIAIGQKKYQTPEFDAEISRIEWNPSWYPPKDAEWAKDEVVTPPGPKNPLGPAKIPLKYGILFHGTPNSRSIGSAASHGCMRMHNRDVKELAWYLQENYSKKNNPSYRKLYEKKNDKTYVVNLEEKIPVKVRYEPIVVEGSKLHFYPDYYHFTRGKRKAFILSALYNAGIELKSLSDKNIETLSENNKINKIEINTLLRENEREDSPKTCG